MKIDYSKFFKKLNELNIKQKDFLKAGFSSSTLNNLRKNQSITTETICRICDYLSCMPDDILEWIPDDNYERRKAEKADIEAKIVELQAKLK